ncbi:hypothetical protein [Pseudoruegeria sp. SK021]|uniref:hypothetical protein n=1 Tax=Pseudoruegeria sp. SK021 TaxID=1933035 RepID=UPI00143D0987|nr:hypothetical protein [Pseudoruegeria sp. SK021]
MKKPLNPIMGVVAPRARPSWASALWLALVLSIPTFVLLSAGEGIWRWLSG